MRVYHGSNLPVEKPRLLVQTKAWHFSSETLYLMFAGEQETGYVSFPEEV